MINSKPSYLISQNLTKVKGMYVWMFWNSDTFVKDNTS